MGSSTIDGLDEDLRCRLSEVERRLRAVLAEPLRSQATHLTDAGGKRMRPLLALLGAQFGNPADPRVIDAAVLTELVHVGTLHHDDVMDDAPVRHGVVTVNALWGNSLAVLLGDLMLARAAELGANLGLGALRMQTTTLARLVRGQLLEAVRPPRDADAMAYCLKIMADRSASLIAMACQLGAHVAGADDDTCAALSRYGEHLGIAFQLADDVLDILRHPLRQDAWRRPACRCGDRAGAPRTACGRPVGRSAARDPCYWRDHRRTAARGGARPPPQGSRPRSGPR